MKRIKQGNWIEFDLNADQLGFTQAMTQLNASLHGFEDFEVEIAGVRMRCKCMELRVSPGKNFEAEIRVICVLSTQIESKGSTKRRNLAERIEKAVEEFNESVAEGAENGVTIVEPSIMDTTNIGEDKSYIISHSGVRVKPEAESSARLLLVADLRDDHPLYPICLEPPPHRSERATYSVDYGDARYSGCNVDVEAMWNDGERHWARVLFDLSSAKIVVERKEER